MSSGSTPNFNIPYPIQTDPVDVAGDMEQLATKIDSYITEWIQDAAGIMITSGTYTNGINTPIYDDTSGTISIALSQDLQVTASPTFVNLNLTGSILTPSVIDVTSSTNALRITQKGSGNALLVEDSTNPDATPFLINADGQIVSGTTSAFSGYNTSLQIVGTDTLPNGGANFRRVSSSTSGQSLFIEKARGTVASPVIVQNNDTIGSITFTGFDGTNWIPAAQIASIVNGGPNTADMPGAITFSTTLDGSSSVTERMRITNNGNIGINKTSPTSTLDVAGTITGTAGVYGDIQSNTATIVNLSSTSIASTNISTSAPTSSNHVATKQYVDNLAGSLSQEVIFFDDISSQFDGQTNRFFLTNNLNGTKIYNRSNLVTDPSFEGTLANNNIVSYPNYNGGNWITRKNLIINPSFETNIFGWDTMGGSPTRDTSTSVYGFSCVSAFYGGSGQAAGIQSSVGMPITAGLQYTFSIWMKQTSATGSAVINVMWYSPNFTLIQDGTHLIINPTDQWSRYSQTVTAPSGSSIAYVRIYKTSGEFGGTNSTNIFIDGIMFEQSSNLNSYFDGSTPDTSLNRVISSWDGTANASTSTMVYSTLPEGVGDRWSSISTPISNAASTLSTSNTEKYIGTRSLRVQTNGSVINQGISYDLGRVNGNTSYTASAYVKSESGRPVTLNIYDRVTGNLVGSASTTSNTWQRLSAIFTTTQNTADLLIVFRTDGTLGASVFYIDAVMCEQTDQLFDYFDGDNAPASSGRIIQKPAWQLTKNNSISTIEYAEPGEFIATNPNRLEIQINGIIQRVSYPEYVWQSMIPQDGFTVGSDGYVTFSEAPVRGSKFDGKYITGNNTVAATNKRTYPFRAIDLLLGS